MAAEGTGLPFKEAIEYFERKVNIPTERSDDLRHGAHVRAFTVSGVTRDDMLADFRAAMQKARSQGTGFKEFQKDFDAIVERTGWKFYAVGDTEEKRRAWRAGVIYRTNMRTSYMAGRYQQMTSPGVLRYRPFWQYKHSGKERFRPTHKALDGKVFRADDPIWNVWYPPNGWGCGCEVVALSLRNMKELGKDGPDEKPDWMVPSEGNDPRTGQIEERWPGIDRGWEYNVGRQALDGLVPVELQTPLPPAGSPRPPRDLPDLPPPHPVPDDRILPAGNDPDANIDAFLAEFGSEKGKPQIWRDPAGGIVTISERLFDQFAEDGTLVDDKFEQFQRGRYLLLAADAIMDPDEIWIDWVETGSSIALRRSYIRSIQMSDGTIGLVRFDWSSKGWTSATILPVSIEEIAAARAGAMLFRRKANGGDRS